MVSSTYLRQRQEMVDKIITSQVTLPRGIGDKAIRTLSEDETILSRHLATFRKADLQKDYLSRPFEDSLPEILNSPLFGVLKAMPKGGNMHIHENHLLSRRTLLDLLWSSPDFPHLHILPEDHPTRPLEMDFFMNPPDHEPWVPVQGHPTYTRDHLVRRLNLVDRFKVERPASHDNVRRWKVSGPLWSVFSKVIANVRIKEGYLRAVMQSCVEEGVQYLETRKSFGDKERVYELSSDPVHADTNGKRYLEPTDGAGTVENGIVSSIGKEFASEKFSSMKRLVQSVRHFHPSRVQEEVERSIQLHKLHPDVIVGFDLAGEEDTGYSTRKHLDSLLAAAQYSRETGGAYKIVSHAGETSNSGTVGHLRPPDDVDLHASSNLVDAVLLNASRIGHGLAAIKHPTLLNTLAERPIPVEICLVCNQILGFIPDLRNHPALHYHRLGIPIVLGSDAHGVLGSEYFTVDWYLAYTAWDLDLADLKQLAYQSLYYSSLASEAKDRALGDWARAWDGYVAGVVRTVGVTTDHE